jgi:endogenous inhibitor of DNA gyrase (YacG/DUF329 family)
VVLLPAQNPCFPFCSERCRAVDLGRWLGEEFRFVTRGADEDDDGEATQGPARAPDA